MSDSDDSPPGRLDEIATSWSLFALAHEAPSTLAAPARSRLVLRYGRAIQSYVRAIVRDDGQAEDLAQDVVVRLLQGDFAGADPERGRFRDLLKTAVRNMIRSHWAKEKRRRPVAHDLESLATDSEQGRAIEAEWTASWRRSVLDLAWRELESRERASPGSLDHTLLRLRADEPDLSSTELAARLAAKLGRALEPAALRQRLRRARLAFAQLVVEEVSRGVDRLRPDVIEDELIATELMEYVRDFLPDDWRERGQLR